MRVDWQMIEQANDIARAFEDPRRLEEMGRYHRAIIGALNVTHTGGEQDALAVFEAVAHTVAQLTGGRPPGKRAGILSYIAARAEALSIQYYMADKVAGHRVFDDAAAKLKAASAAQGKE